MRPMIWLLILHIVLDPGVSAVQAGPFATKQECTTAGDEAVKKFPGQVRFVCVQSSAKQQ